MTQAIALMQHAALHGDKCSTKLQHTKTRRHTLQQTVRWLRGQTWMDRALLTSLSSSNLLRCIYNTLHNTGIHCSILQHTAPHCITLLHTYFLFYWGYTTCGDTTKTHCNTLQHTATHCNTLQHTATHCNTLPCTVPHCNTHSTLHHTESQCTILHFFR